MLTRLSLYRGGRISRSHQPIVLIPHYEVTFFKQHKAVRECVEEQIEASPERKLRAPWLNNMGQVENCLIGFLHCNLLLLLLGFH